MDTGQVSGVVFQNTAAGFMTAVCLMSGKVYLDSDIISYSLVSFLFYINKNFMIIGKNTTACIIISN